MPWLGRLSRLCPWLVVGGTVTAGDLTNDGLPHDTGVARTRGRRGGQRAYPAARPFLHVEDADAVMGQGVRGKAVVTRWVPAP